MGFLDRIFGRREREQEIVELRLDEVGPFVEERAAEKSAVLEKEVPARFAEIKHLIKETRTLLDELDREEIGEEGNKRFRKAVRTAKKDSIKKMNAVLHKIQPPFSAEPERIRSYAQESLALLREKVRASSKSLAYTGVVLRDAMRELGKRMNALEHSLKSLVETVRENNILFERESLAGSVAGIKADKAELQKLLAEVSTLRETLGEIKARSASAKSSLEKLLKSDASRELRSLEEGKRKLMIEVLSLKGDLINTVAGVGRPAKKLDNLVRKGKYFIDRETQSALSSFLKEPSTLFKRDPKAESFKLLLKELKGAIASGKLDLKGKEREKKLAEIETLLEFDFFSNFFWKENELEKKMREIAEKEKSIEVKGKIDRIERSISELDRDYNQTTNAISELEKKAQRLREKISASTKSLGSMLSGMTKEEIEVAEPAVEAPPVEAPARKPIPEKPPEPPKAGPVEKPLEKPKPPPAEKPPEPEPAPAPEPVEVPPQPKPEPTPKPEPRPKTEPMEVPPEPKPEPIQVPEPAPAKKPPLEEEKTEVLKIREVKPEKPPKEEEELAAGAKKGIEFLEVKESPESRKPKEKKKPEIELLELKGKSED